MAHRSLSDSDYHAIGIDIADGSLEYADVIETRDGTVALNDIARVELPDQTIVHGLIRNERVLGLALKNLLNSVHMQEERLSVVSALTDEQIIVKTIPLESSPKDIPIADLPALARRLYAELGYHIPKPLLQWRYSTHAEHGAMLTLYATSSGYVQQWLRFFKKHSIKLDVLEMESLAVARAIIRRCGPDELIGVIDLGFRQTNFSIFAHTGLLYSHTIDGGGLAITRAIAEQMGTTLDHAEELKLGVDLLHKSQAMADMRALIAQHLTQYFDAARTAIVNHNFPLTRVLLTGGGARIKGVVPMAEHAFGTSVRQGSLWLAPLRQKNIRLQNILSHDEEQIYAGAVGLALRGQNRYTLRSGINFIQ